MEKCSLPLLLCGHKQKVKLQPLEQQNEGHHPETETNISSEIHESEAL